MTSPLLPAAMILGHSYLKRLVKPEQVIEGSCVCFRLCDLREYCKSEDQAHEFATKWRLGKQRVLILVDVDVDLDATASQLLLFINNADILIYAGKYNKFIIPPRQTTKADYAVFYYVIAPITPWNPFGTRDLYYGVTNYLNTMGEMWVSDCLDACFDKPNQRWISSQLRQRSKSEPITTVTPMSPMSSPISTSVPSPIISHGGKWRAYSQDVRASSN